MAELIPFVFGMGAADVVLFLVFGALYRREREEHLRAWAWAHALDAGRQLAMAAQVSLGASVVLDTTGALAQTLGAWFLLHGAMAFVGRRTHWSWTLGAAVVATWVPLARVGELDFALTQLPTSVFLGTARVAAGLVLLRAGGMRTPRMVAGIALVLWGLHSWNYPFLREVQWFAPWGFTLATLLATCVGFGMLLLHLERARDAERSAATRFQELFDGAMEGIFRSSTEGRFLAANPALVRMLGYEREEEVLELDLMRDVYARASDRARILAHQDGDTDTFGVKRRDGSIIEVEIHARRSRDAAGAVRWFEGSMRDVTESKRLRDELARAQRMEALGRMAGGIAHDFNNVLGTIVAATELAKLRISRGGQAEAELDDVLDSALRAAAMTGQLLALGRGQPLNRCQPSDLREPVGTSARLASRVLGEKVRLEVDLGTEPRIVVVDGGQLENLVTNLVLNARDAMPDGGVLQISITEVELEGRAYARLRVRDDGIGMTVETRARMFDPFFTTKPQGAGMGLGLATVYGSVTRAGGRIEVESAPGAGTCIDVLLPVAAGVAEPPECATLQAPISGVAARGVRILVVEDEPALRRSISAALSEAGHAVMSVENGAAALAYLETESVDVLVTDLVMPGVSGTEVALAVRAKLPECGVVYVSGYAADRLEDAMRDDAELLAKPFTIGALVAAVSRCVTSRAELSARESA